MGESSAIFFLANQPFFGELEFFIILLVYGTCMCQVIFCHVFQVACVTTGSNLVYFYDVACETFLPSEVSYLNHNKEGNHKNLRLPIYHGIHFFAGISALLNGSNIFHIQNQEIVLCFFMVDFRVHHFMV